MKVIFIRYMESFISNSLYSNKKRYISLVLPYADVEISDQGKFLKYVTTNYRLMYDIEAFYFHIQGNLFYIYLK